MSRRRQDRKEKKRELARQLGVSAAEAPDDLRARQRVTRVELRLTEVVVEEAPRRLLGRAPVVVEGAVALVEHGAVRWVTGLVASASTGEKRGETVPLDDVRATLDDDGRLRYARPASFVLLVAVVPDPAPAAFTDVEPASVRVAFDGAAFVALSDKSLLHRPAHAPLPATLVVVGAERPGAVVVYPAVHRLREELDVVVHFGKSRWRVRGRLEA